MYGTGRRRGAVHESETILVRSMMAEKLAKPKYPQWDPTKSEDWLGESYSREAIVRIKRYCESYCESCCESCCIRISNAACTNRLTITVISMSEYAPRDLQMVYEDPPSGICVLPKNESLTTVSDLIRDKFYTDTGARSHSQLNK